MYVIRPAGPGDAEAVEAVFAAAGLIPYRDTPEVVDPTFVAVDGARVVGAIEGRFDAGMFPEGSSLADAPEPRAWIDRIGVDPSERRRGIARALVHIFVEQAASHGCGHVALSVDESTDRTDRIKFFKTCGLNALNAPDSLPDAHMGADVPSVLAATMPGG
jgi:ribosomal protein S18 acetylase RimI-like enzyme